MSECVSVIVPVYKGEHFVHRAIQSALQQTHRNIEVIAINDGSPDNSLSVLREFGNQIHVINQKNTGVAGARNAGISRSRGQYIAFLDQDDWWSPEKIERQLHVIRKSKNIGLVHTGVAHIDAKTNSKLAPLNPNSKPELMRGDCYKRLLLGNPIYNSSVLIRSETIEKVGGCNPALAGNTVADYELWLRIAKHYKFEYVDSEETYYCMHPDQGIWDRRAMLRAELDVLLNIKSEYEWKADQIGRTRLSQLYDELAVNLYDYSDHDDARKYFWMAFSMSPSKSSLFRWIASNLPPTIVSRFRT